MKRSAILIPLASLFLVPLLSQQDAGAKVVRTDSNIPQLLTGFSAQESCSCAFVTQQTDDYCNTFGQQDGFTVVITFDHTANKVTASYAGTTRTAEFTAGSGCTADPP